MILKTGHLDSTGRPSYTNHREIAFYREITAAMPVPEVPRCFEAAEASATNDLAYMLAMLWYPDRRGRMERPLLDHYHAELLTQGVLSYDRETLAADYRLSVLWLMMRPIWQAQSNIPSRVWWDNLERIMLAVDDLDCRELLA